MTRMRAVVATALGGPEVLELRDLPLPEIRGARDVLVRLKAASLNPADAYFRRFGPSSPRRGPSSWGMTGPAWSRRSAPGSPASGPATPSASATAASGPIAGSYAEFAVVPESQLVRKPDGVCFAEAAALPLVSITLWESLYDRARVRRGRAS